MEDSKKVISFPIYRTMSPLDPDCNSGAPGRARRPHKTLLIGDLRSSNIGTAILDYLKSRFVDRYRVSTIFTGKSDEILAVAIRYKIPDGIKANS